MKSFRHRLLSLGLLSLAGAASATYLTLKEKDGGLTSRPARIFPATALRIFGEGSENSSFSTAPADFGSGRPTSRDNDGGHFSDSLNEPRSRKKQRLPAEEFHAADIKQPDAGPAGEGQESETSISAGSIKKEFSFPGGQPWRVNESSAPGNQLSFKDQLASVTSSQPVPGTLGVTLAVVVQDLPPEPPVAFELTGGPETGHEKVSSPSGSIRIDRAAGFTYEQQLFRTKWGWAAYDQVQKLLRRETSD